MSHVSTLDKIGKTVQFYSRLFLQQWRELTWPLVRHTFEKPIFVLGCSRSGTTVMYKVLSMAKGLASLDKETHDFWNSLHPPEEKNWESHQLGKKDVSDRDRIRVARFFFRHVGMSRFVDKANQNCFRIHYLLELFPDARFVYVKRDGRDNINSLIHGWGRPEEFAIWKHSFPEKVMVDNGRYQSWSFFLFQGWRSLLNARIEEVCAHQWIAANEAILSARTFIPSFQWIEISYEDILSSPVETFQKVFEQLEIPFAGKAKNHCGELLENPYNAFSTPRLNKWKDENRERIERVMPAIQKTMTRMGYRRS